MFMPLLDSNTCLRHFTVTPFYLNSFLFLFQSLSLSLSLKVWPCMVLVLILVLEGLVLVLVLVLGVQSLKSTLAAGL